MDWSDQFALWKEYESIAIHFNQLILSLRTQALGGVAATVVLLVGLLAQRGGSESEQQTKEKATSANWGALACAFLLLSLLWLALSVLDLKYYHKLLEGSVRGIIALEKNTTMFGENSTIALSHHIRYAVDPSADNTPDFEHMTKLTEDFTHFEETEAVYWFYGIVLVTLLFCFAVSLIRRIFLETQRNSFFKITASAACAGIPAVLIGLAFLCFIVN